MRVWEEEPKSVATGILDDETYDWRAVVEGMLMTGGRPLVVSEDQLLDAHRLAVPRTTIQVDPTGSSGLAGLLEMRTLDQLATRIASPCCSPESSDSRLSCGPCQPDITCRVYVELSPSHGSGRVG